MREEGRRNNISGGFQFSGSGVYDRVGDANVLGEEKSTRRISRA